MSTHKRSSSLQPNVENDEILARNLQKVLYQAEPTNFEHQSGKKFNQMDHSNDEILALTIQEQIYQDEPMQATSPYGELGQKMKQMGRIDQVSKNNEGSVDEESLIRRRLSDKLRAKGMIEHLVQGDGNCQFRALSHQLYGSTEYHDYVRQNIVTQLQSHQHLYEGYVDSLEYGDYVKKMAKFGEWGDHISLQAAADFYGTKIIVITSDEDPGDVNVIPRGQISTEVIHLSFLVESHYNSVSCRGGVAGLNPYLPAPDKKKKRREASVSKSDCSVL